MNTEERKLLTDFLDQLKQVKGVTKDPEAEALIGRAVAEQPDAHYLLVQKALLQEQALNAAKAQIADLRRQLEQATARTAPARGGSFLGSDPWASSSGRPSAPPTAAGAWGQAPAPQAGPSPLGSFLGTAAATAAGVAGGAFLFQGIESLLGHHGSGGGFFDTASATPEHVENVTINEYYDTGDDEPNPDSDLYQEADYDPMEDGFSDFDDDDDSLSV